MSSRRDDEVGLAIPNQAIFDQSEYKRRWQQVRHHMASAGVDALVTFGPHNVTYLTGMDSENLFDYQCALITLEDRPPTLIIFDLELARAENSAAIDDVRAYGPFSDPVQFTKEQLGFLPAKATLAVDRSTLGVDSFEALAAALSDYTLVDAFGLVEEARLVKSPPELELMERAANLTDIGVAAGIDAVAEGEEDRSVAAAIVDAMYRAGSDTLCWGPVVAAGYRAGAAHSTFNGHRIARGETVFLELTGEVSRYVSPLMRTVVVDEPTPAMRRVEAAVAAALDAIVSSAAPGRSARSVAEAGLAALEGVLDGHVFHHYFGYPVGLGYPPTWIESLGFFLRTDNERPLADGMVFHLPISVRRYGEYGVNLSWTMVVDGDSTRLLGSSPAQLAVV